jgi:lysophospholipase L1-like esterase
MNGSVLKLLRLIGALILIGFVLRGIAAIDSELSGVATVIPWAVVVAVTVLRIAIPAGTLGTVVVVIGAMVVAVAFLVGVNVIVGDPEHRLDPWLGFLLGLVIIEIGAWLYVEVWPDKRTGRAALVPASIGVSLLVVVPPLVALGAAAWSGDETILNPDGNTSSNLEVIVLRADAAPPAPGRETSHGWSVTTWTGLVRRAANGPWTIDWGEVGPPPAVPAQDADRVLLLRPDQRVPGWLRAADTVTPLGTPTFAIVSSDDPTLKARWDAALDGNGITRRRGRAYALDPLRPKATAELAVELAQLAPAAEQDFALAAQHRPALFFDTGEGTPTTYNVDRLIESGKMKLCKGGQSQDLLCLKLTRPQQLRSEAGRLTFDPDELRAITEDTTVYLNVRHTGNDVAESIYLDYWWYFPYNPAGAGDGALCGAGFNVAGMTCFDHQSDWEGVTVVLDGDDPTGPPIAVHYAQHDDVSRYSWAALQEIWEGGIEARFGAGIDTTKRPLVFVANGRHASYPVDCRRGAEESCSTFIVPGRRDFGRIHDRRFDGAEAWSGNANACLPGCLTPLPTRREGQERASWHAFAGRWGTADCVLAVICSESNPPSGPGEQDRYEEPWCADQSFEFAAGEWTFKPELPCEEYQPAASELATGRPRMVALGDSFSSGQGAGRYHRGTDGDGNTCYRSNGAWPPLVARALDWTPVAFVACSGAYSAEVIHDDARIHDEEERNQSQIGRIPDNAQLLTLTIGGNDIGFSSVVKSCVFGNCKTKFDRPSGDELDRRIADLRERLPEVYREVMRAAPGAKLVVVDYPRLLPQGSREERARNCAAPGGTITADEVSYLNEKTARLDEAIKAAAADAGARFVEVIDAFAGHELRCDGRPFANPARVQAKLRPASFHPNAAGYVQLADVIARDLAAKPP